MLVRPILAALGVGLDYCAYQVAWLREAVNILWINRGEVRANYFTGAMEKKGSQLSSCLVPLNASALIWLHSHVLM